MAESEKGSSSGEKSSFHRQLRPQRDDLRGDICEIIFPPLNKAAFKKSELGGTAVCYLFIYSSPTTMQPRHGYVGLLLRNKPWLLFSKEGIIIIVTMEYLFLSACFFVF